MSNLPDKRKKNPTNFGRNKKFGYPIDISGLENRGSGFSGRDSLSEQTFLNTLQAAMLRICIEAGNPMTELVKQEEEELQEEIKRKTATWLIEAMKRLPPDQEICLYHRFKLDSKSINAGVRNMQEVADMIGVSQPTVTRNIQRGLKNLRKDFKKNLEPELRRLKS